MLRTPNIWGTATILLLVAAVGGQGPERAGGGAPQGDPVALSQSEASPPRITREDSVMVFAAHPDDEVLGAGGVIHAAARSGARVYIVLFTNGDGYLAGVAANFRTLLGTPGRFIEYGRRRQREAVAAARRLGVPASHVVFLGYPDRGLAVLWGPGWGCDHPYTSPYTHRSTSPYALAYRRSVSYCGQHVLEDVASLLRSERPTIIVSHHPGDTHRDHWAAGAFVAAALERLRTERVPWAGRARVWSYLVHRGDWPRPEGYVPNLALTPPADLAANGARWTEYGLDPADRDAKRRATQQYRTQMKLLKPYMLSFVRQNELFDTHPPTYPSVIEGEALPIGAPEFWDRVPPIIRSAPGSALARALRGSAQLDTVGLAKDSAHLYVAIRLKRAAIPEVGYRVPITLFYRDGRTARLRLLFRVPRTLGTLRSRGDLALPAGAVALSSGRHINIVLPSDGIGSPESLLLHVETTGPLRTQVERSSWALVHLRPLADQTEFRNGPAGGNWTTAHRILESRDPRRSFTQ